MDLVVPEMRAIDSAALDLAPVPAISSARFVAADQPVLRSEQRGGGTARDAELGVDVFYVVGHRLRAQEQALRDLPVRLSASK
jgi:hypothetical protein